MLQKGVLVWKASAYANVVRLLPPLIITKELLDKGLDILIETIKEVESSIAK